MSGSDHDEFGGTLAAVSIGRWRIETGDGREPRLYTDAVMNRLLGLPETCALSPEALYRAWYDFVDPAHYDAVAEWLSRLVKGELTEIQYPWHHPDGRVIVVRCGGIRDMTCTSCARITGVHQWVTTMGHVDRVLEAQQKRLSALAALSNQCISVFDVDLESGTFEIVKQPATTDVMNRKDRRWDLALGRDFAEECHPETRDIMRRIGSVEFLRSELRYADHREYSYRHQLEVGHTLFRRCMVLALGRDEKGEATRALVDFVAVDDHQAKILEQQQLLDRQSRELKEALAQAMAANKAKNTFLFNMSHDIRTPMNAITGFCHVALDNLDRPDVVRDCLVKSQKSGELMTSLIDGILDMCRMESGDRRIEESVGDVMLSFADIESTMMSMAASAGVRLEFGFGRVTDRYVYVDIGRCLRVFVNLISNAVKFSKHGGWVKVTCEQLEEDEERRRRDAEWREKGASADRRAWFRYTVEDNGIGMSEEFQNHVFEEFARERNSTASGIQGTGLGLSICKSFVDQMGGTITCRSRQGVGSTFVVELPLRLQEGREYLDPETKTVVSEGCGGEFRSVTPSLAGRRVLLVEDNLLNREVAEYVLRSGGAEVECAENGAVAVRMVSARGPEHYDFVLMDIQMPVMDGYEATRAIRRIGYTRPIVALSANAMAEDRAAALESGMNAHVAKPFKSNELMSLLAGCLSPNG